MSKVIDFKRAIAKKEKQEKAKSDEFYSELNEPKEPWINLTRIMAGDSK